VRVWQQLEMVLPSQSSIVPAGMPWRWVHLPRTCRLNAKRLPLAYADTTELDAMSTLLVPPIRVAFGLLQAFCLHFWYVYFARTYERYAT
jgi:hypothetical protein